MAKDTKLTVSLILNDAGFSKQIAAVNRELKLNQSEFKKASSTSEDFGKSMQGAQTKLSTLTSQLESQGKKVTLYKNEISKTNTTLDDMTKKYKEQSTTLTALQGKYDSTVAAMGENSVEAKALKAEITALEKSQTNLGNKILSTNTRLDGLNTSLNNAESEFNQLEREVQEADKAFRNFNVDTMTQNMNMASTALKNAGDKISKVGSTMQSVGRNMSMYMTLPLVGVGTAAIKTSMSFEKSMSNVKAVSGVTGDEFSALTLKAREMGEKTSKSATDAANALGYMGLAGWDTKEMMAGLEPILRLSEAGTMDLGLASDLVTDSMGALKLEVEDMPTYLDQVAQTSVKTNTSIQQLMEALLNAGGSAKTLKMPLEETNALLGVLGNNGTKGYEAGTKLNSMLVRMAAQSKPAAEAWDNLGVSVFDGEGKFRGMNTVLMETKEKFKTLSEEEQMYFMKRAVGTDNINTFTQLMDASGKELEDLTGTIKDSNGELMKVAKTMQDNTAGAFEQFKSKAEEAAIKLGETLLPMINKLLDSLMGLLDKFNSLSPQMQENIVKFGLFAAAIGPVTSGLGGMVKGIGSVVKLGGGFISAMTGSAAAAAATGTGTVAAASGAAAVGSALGAAALAAAPWVAGGAAVVATGYAIGKVMTNEVVPKVDLFANSFEQTATTAETAMNGVAAGYQTTSVIVSDATEEAVQAYLTMDETVRNTLFNAYVNGTTITTAMKDEMSAKFKEMGTNIKTELDNDLKASTDSLSSFFKTSYIMTTEEEAKVLESNRLHYEAKKTEIDGYEKQIEDIIRTASMSKRSLTNEEVENITSLQNKMRDASIKAHSETEAEASLIIGRLASYDERITAEMASKHISEAENMRIKSVDAATAEYNERKRQIELLRDESKVISADQADKLIKDAQRQKDDTVKAAQEQKDKVIRKIEEMNSDVLEDVDTSSGKIMGLWDKMQRKWDNWFPKKKKMTVETENVTTNTTRTGGSGGSLEYSAKPFSIQPLSIQPFSDSLEVPNSSSYASSAIETAVGTARVKDAKTSDVVEVMSKTLNETIRQNDLLLTMLIAIQQQQGVNVQLEVDGRQIAKATAQYMSKEIDSINNRKNRLGGAF